LPQKEQNSDICSRTKDEFFIRETFTIAKKAKSLTYPNPLVGALLIKNNEIIGEGYHKKYGGPHAEVEAINDCLHKGNSPKDSTLYVSLEPCSHHGKTPPCTDLIIKSGIKKVVFPFMDPNPKVNGLEELKKAGIETTCGILAHQARSFNQAFLKHQTTGMPFVTLKIASSIDFKIWSPEITKITGLESQKFVHELRSKSTSVLTGIGTILKDNPYLTVRLVKGKNPTPVILDSTLKIPLKSNVLKQKNTIICTTIKNSPKKEQLKKLGIKILTFKTLSNLKPILKKLADLGHINILVEGGQKIINSFINQNLTDRILLLISDIELGEYGPATLPKSLPNFEITNTKKLKKDIMLELRQIHHL
jgi:diaminohydroxyphosphoribosylaminopyrimidine deaminase/5-amino-6-(5-phosphoribosylamino)uracil reductase